MNETTGSQPPPPVLTPVDHVRLACHELVCALPDAAAQDAVEKLIELYIYYHKEK